jgi:predicted Zn-dependent peptidase
MKHTVLPPTIFVNGTGLYFIDVQDSSVVEMRMYFKAGFEYFDHATYHVPHLLEHLLIGNGGIYDSEEKLLHALQNLGANINASTDYEHITVYLRSPYKNFIAALTIAFDCLFNINITQEALDRERQVVIREVYEQHDSVGNRILNSMLSHGLDDLVPHDWEDYIKQTADFTLEQIESAYSTYIVPKNMTVIIGGKMTIADRQEAERLFSELPMRIDTPPAIRTITPQESGISGANADLGDSASITYIFMSRSPKVRNAKKRAANNMAGLLLFDAPTAILPLKLREKGIVYSVTSDVINLTDWRIVIINVVTAPEKAHIASAEILQYLHLYANGHISKRDFDSIKSFVENNLSISYETVGDLIEWYSGDILTGALPNSVNAEIKIVRELTIDDVAQAMSDLFIDADLYGAIICQDADLWALDLNAIRTTIESGESEQTIRRTVDTTITGIGQRRTVGPVRSGWKWAFYWILAYASWISAVFVTLLPLKGSGNTVSVFDFAWDHNLVWGLCFFIPMTSANFSLYLRGEYKNKGEITAVILNMIAAVVYGYGVYRYFGDIGVDNQPWLEDVVSIVQPFFFFVACPLAFYSVINTWVKTLHAKHTSN